MAKNTPPNFLSYSIRQVISFTLCLFYFCNSFFRSKRFSETVVKNRFFERCMCAENSFSHLHFTFDVCPFMLLAFELDCKYYDGIGSYFLLTVN